MLDKQQIATHPGLSRSFIDPCPSLFRPLFAPHIIYGEKNKLWLDHGGFAIFDKSKQLKETDKTCTLTYCTHTICKNM
jgi:hypothetical protein